jgi:hypothetical protein
MNPADGGCTGGRSSSRVSARAAEGASVIARTITKEYTFANTRIIPPVSLRDDSTPLPTAPATLGRRDVVKMLLLGRLSLEIEITPKAAEEASQSHCTLPLK